MPIPALPREILLQIAEQSLLGYGYHHNLQVKASSQTSPIFLYVARQERFKEVKLKISKKRMKLAKRVFTNPEVACHVRVLQLSFSDLDSKIDPLEFVKLMSGKNLGSSVSLLWRGNTGSHLRDTTSSLAPYITKLSVHVDGDFWNRRSSAAFFGVVVGLLSTIQFPLLRTFEAKPPSCIAAALALWDNTSNYRQRLFGASALEVYQENLNHIQHFYMNCYERNGDPVDTTVRDFEEWVSSKLQHLYSLKIDAVENRHTWNPACQLHVCRFSTLTNLTNFSMSDTQISDELSRLLQHLAKLKKLYFYHVRLIHTTERWCNVFRNVVLLRDLEYFYAAGVGYSQVELLDMWCWDYAEEHEDHSDICTQWEEDRSAMTDMGAELDVRGVLKNKLPFRFCGRYGLQLV